jgi:protein O-GlcNAc transferase
MAAALISQAAALAPENATIRCNLGEVYQHLRRLDEAIACLRLALTLEPNSAIVHNNLGNALRAQGRRDEAASCFREAISLRPDFAEAHSNLGNLYGDQAQFTAASACLRQALALKPEIAEFHDNLGVVLREQGQLDEAIASHRRALALKPNLANAHNNLGGALNRQGHADEALACFQRAIALKPDLAEAHNNLGSVLQYRGQLDDAIACFRQALALSPDRANIHSNIILALQYHFSGHESGAVGAELRRWNQQHAVPRTTAIRPHVNERSPDRRLRIGYVSPDFRAHPVGLNLLPLFQHQARDQLEIFCYAQVSPADAVTEIFRARCDHWHDIARLSDAELSELIRRDQIDILVDLALHTAKGRLTAFALKPAPVQVSFAGYPAGTGLAAIDCHLTDPYLTPPKAKDELGSDAPFRLPDTFWCYDPRAEDLAVAPLPALAAGRPTFGCLNNFCKVNAAVLQLWARVLLAVPDSRLLLLAPAGDARRPALARFAQAGVDADRIEFVDRQPREKYLAQYQRIDLGLDTFPYNGHTTSLDSYWMGVPVVTLVGQTSVARAGWSQLSNLGLTELAAHTPDEFVNIAATLARDLPRLATLRAGLRERMRRSPLMDGPRFARAIEAAYRTLWQCWCTRSSDSGPTSATP